MFQADQLISYANLIARLEPLQVFYMNLASFPRATWPQRPTYWTVQPIAKGATTGALQLTMPIDKNGRQL